MNSSCASAPQFPDPRVAFFDALAAAWDRTGPDPASTLRKLQALSDTLGLQPGWNVLEVGCGTGQITAWLAAAVYPGRVTAADFSPAMLARARARGVDADFVLLDICGEAPGSPPFDVVLCFNSFPHFRDKPAALRHMACSLQPAGQLLVLHLAGSAQINQFHHGVGGPVAHDFLAAAEDWAGLVAPHGLRISEAVDREDLFLVRAVRWRQMVRTSDRSGG